MSYSKCSVHEPLRKPRLHVSLLLLAVVVQCLWLLLLHGQGSLIFTLSPSSLDYDVGGGGAEARVVICFCKYVCACVIPAPATCAHANTKQAIKSYFKPRQGEIYQNEGNIALKIGKDLRKNASGGFFPRSLPKMARK